MAGFSSITGDEAIMYADNSSFDGTQRGGKMTTDGQLWIGSTASNRPNNGGHVRLGSLTSPDGSITIGYSAPNITIQATGGQATTKFAVDTTTGGGTNPVLPTAGGQVTVTGGQYPTGTFGTRVITINSPAPNTFAAEVQISTTSASSLITNNGVCHFNSADFTVDANGFVTAISTSFNYTNVNHAASPYTVLATDEYISVDCSAGVVTLNFPNAPTFKRQWVVKDRTGNASTNNISITTPGGVVTIDGQTTYKITSNFGAINLLANATPTYEVF